MKHLIYFLLFSTVVFSQNYQYAIENISTTIPSTGANNQLEEIEYFDAYLLPIAQKANLQKALDDHGSVRLEKGDYSGIDIVIKTGQKLYGHPSLTSRVSTIKIAGGSKNIRLENLFLNDSEIIFQSGGTISGCIIKTIKWTTLVATNAQLENNSFINIQGRINFNCSNSGFFRNNKFIKHQSGSWSNLIIMKGNSSAGSYGNVHLWSNILTPHGNSTEFDNLQSSTFVGIDAESWNYFGEGQNALITARNMGSFKITDMGGGNGPSKVHTPAYDIEAKNVYFLNKMLRSGEYGESISANAKVFSVGSLHDYSRKTSPVTGYDMKAHFLDTPNEADFLYNGTVQPSIISNTTISNNIKSELLGPKYTPWERPVFETLPDPLGPNWKNDRKGKPDQTSYIQDLINNNKIAELKAGTYYIGSTLKLPVDNEHGLIGQGTGKTVIVGLSDDFPLISLIGGLNGSFVLANLTLQGGSVGVYASQDNNVSQHIAYQNVKFVVFRNQKYGIQLKSIMGFDNNFLDNVSFVNCTKGFFQDPFLPWDNDIDKSSFVDKTMFYKNQFINCETAVGVNATRSDNLNAWVDCKFDNNAMAINMSGNNAPIVANCDFTNNRGEYVIAGEMSIYNCNFSNNNPSKAIFMSKVMYIEGCNLLDSAKLFPSEIHWGGHFYILNSTVKGNVTKGYGISNAIYINSNLLANPDLNKLLVNVKENVPTVLIDEAPNPYPQLLVTQ